MLLISEEQIFLIGDYQVQEILEEGQNHRKNVFCVKVYNRNIIADRKLSMSTNPRLAGLNTFEGRSLPITAFDSNLKNNVSLIRVF